MEAGGPSVILAPSCAPSCCLTWGVFCLLQPRQPNSHAPTIPGLIPFAPPLLRTTLNPLMALHQPASTSQTLEDTSLLNELGVYSTYQAGILPPRSEKKRFPVTLFRRAHFGLLVNVTE